VGAIAKPQSLVFSDQMVHPARMAMLREQQEIANACVVQDTVVYIVRRRCLVQRVPMENRATTVVPSKERQAVVVVSAK